MLKAVSLSFRNHYRVFSRFFIVYLSTSSVEFCLAWQIVVSPKNISVMKILLVKGFLQLFLKIGDVECHPRAEEGWSAAAFSSPVLKLPCLVARSLFQGAVLLLVADGLLLWHHLCRELSCTCVITQGRHSESTLRLKDCKCKEISL